MVAPEAGIDLKQMDRDLEIYSEIDKLGGIELPEQYAVACSELDLSAKGMATAMREAIAADDNFTEAEKKQYKYEVSRRIRTANAAAAPEEWND